MKKIFILLFIFLSLCFSISAINAEETYDISKWTFLMKTKGSDQDDSVVISKYYNVDNRDLYAFCLEPNVRFLPVSATYYKKNNTSKRVFDIVKAYDDIGLNDENYYLAAQILIWRQTVGIDYTFEGNDYKEYKENLEKQILLNNNPTTISNTYYFKLDNEYKIDEDYSNYDISCNDIDVISNDSNGFTFKLKENKPNNIEILLSPKDQESKNAYVYYSETSQDLYHYEGLYYHLSPIKLNINFESNYYTINYSKKDENNKPIKGAEFALYKIDSNSNDSLIFIKNDVDTNIYESIVDNYNDSNSYTIEISERYRNYLNKNIIHPKEVGYFDYVLYENKVKIDNGRVYVTDDNNICVNNYNRINSKLILSSYSEDIDVNSINDVSKDYDYYLCEYEPAKGYTYSSEPCTLIDSSEYKGETIEYINNSRTYTLRLMKHNNENVMLDGAEFKITYNEGDKNTTKYFTTGSLYINNIHENKYLFLKNEKNEIEMMNVDGDDYEDLNIEKGRYYYYFSNNNILNNLEFKEYVDVIKGGFNIVNLPYSSSVEVEELKAPKGYTITEPIFYIYPDIKYSQITFTNYRINYLDIIPGKKFEIPKTCVGD